MQEIIPKIPSFRTSQVSQFTGIPLRTIQRMVFMGEIASIKVPHQSKTSYRIPRQVVINLLDTIND